MHQAWSTAQSFPPHLLRLASFLAFGGWTPRTESLTVVNVIFLIVSTLALCLRLFTRIHVMRLFGIDDCEQFLISLHTDCSKLLCGYCFNLRPRI
ncbi:hypothetical protein V2W45_4824 [Cenococcum geophilum]